MRIVLIILCISYIYASSATNAGIALAQKGDYEGALSLFSEACNVEGDANGCLGVGLMHMYAIGTNTNEEKAIKYYKKACSAGNAIACSNIASIYDNGTSNIPQDKMMANELYTVSCNGGDAFACNNLGYMYANGIGIQKDLFKSLQYYKFACDMGSSLGCYNLGLLSNTHNIFGLQKDKLGLLDLNYVACNKGDLIGCANLGYMYGTGKHGAPKSGFNATRYLRIACEGGIISSCNNLAIIYENGDGVKQDKNIALELYGISCENGLEESCKNYSRLNKNK